MCKQSREEFGSCYLSGPVGLEADGLGVIS